MTSVRVREWHACSFAVSGCKVRVETGNTCGGSCYKKDISVETVSAWDEETLLYLPVIAGEAEG